jgi:hypothetical protein
MGEDTKERPVIKPPLTVKKLEKIQAWVKASGQRWMVRDGKRLWADNRPSSASGVTTSWNWPGRSTARPATPA